jgi:hypothetical protein
MAAETNFKTLIQSLSGTLVDPAGDLNAEKWCIDGCYDVISKLKARGSGELSRFLKVVSSNITATDTHTAGVSLSSIREVALVTRDGIICKESSRLFFDKLTDVASTFYASEKDPAFIREASKLYIFPACSGSKIGLYYSVPEYTLSSFDSGATTITEEFPKDFYEHVVVYASILNLEERVNNYLEDDEDIELVNGAQAQLASLKQRYETMFGVQ